MSLWRVPAYEQLFVLFLVTFFSASSMNSKAPSPEQPRDEERGVVERDTSHTSNPLSPLGTPLTLTIPHLPSLR